MNVLVSAALALLCSLPGTDTPSELVDALKKADPALEIAALLSMDPAEALPPLTACIREANADHAWRAGQVVQQILLAGPKHKVWMEAVPELLSITLDESKASPNRAIAALSVRGAEKAAKKVLPDLAELLATSTTPDEVRLGVTLCCGKLGKIAVKSLKKGMQKEGMMKMVWATTSIACLGAEGASAKSHLAGLIEEEDSLTAFLACRSNRLALEMVAGRDATAKPFKTRLSRSRGRIWSGGAKGMNFGGVVPKSPTALISYFALQVNKPSRDVSKMSLPASLQEPMNGSVMTMADAIQCFALHLTEQVLLLDEGLAKDEFPTWSKWQESVLPILALVDYLNELDGYVGP